MKQLELGPLCSQIFFKATSVSAGNLDARIASVPSFKLLKNRKSDQARIFRKKVRTRAAAGCRI